jgi:serine/threonine-protein kinase
MAPEQFEGKGASIQSDIYALGLVLYEIYGGKHAFTGTTIAEIREQKERRTPPSLSEIRVGIDSAVERLIMRCIERDPRLRPGSVAQLAIALPGGDPLAAAIAAGETPSPEMVAASGVKEGLRPSFALALVAMVVIGIVGVMVMNPRMTMLQRVPAGKPRDVLIERARELMKRSGYTMEADHASGFIYNGDLIQYLRNVNATPDRWKDVEALYPIFFWYRSSPRPMQHLRTAEVLSRVSVADPPMFYSGDVTILLDGLGRLRGLLAVPPERDTPVATPQPMDWALLFSEAGLEMSKWRPVEPQLTPLFYADSRMAWEGSFPETPDIPIRIEAASYRGQPVNFAIQGPWSRPNRMASAPIRTAAKITSWISVFLLLASFGGGLFFARANLRLGRGDRRGATRLAIFVMVLLTLDWIAAEHHVATQWELYLVFYGLVAYTLLDCRLRLDSLCGT